ncbi:ParB N-terminal domain-containing protein [Kitasatospora sp. NPDC006697]|uniref:ParB N-terminal domain-containing protein n=1 Tax=Kitasatospora sp. NPDC006697 TaxID=3364020 RepID=UPI00367F332E
MMDRLNFGVTEPARAVRAVEAVGPSGPAGTQEPAATGTREVVAVPIAALVPAGSVRSAGYDPEHVRALAEVDGPLPPILVDRRTMRVIDGEHRLLAARSRGARTIDVEFFDGSSEDAFLRAVEANTAHGLPLSQSDRRAAAERIINSHPYMSDRAIARVAGLGAKTVAAIRRRAADGLPELAGRIGRDGRVRPLNSEAGRQRAAELIARSPHASLREVARQAGISPATVSDVRRRLELFQDPLPGRSATAREGEPGAEAARPAVSVPAQRHRGERRARTDHRDPAQLLEKLVRDPSLRHKEEGRQLLRLLQQNAIGRQGWSELTEVVPSHCRDLVVDLARQYAETWQGFAQELDEKVRAVGYPVAPPEPAGAAGF